MKVKSNIKAGDGLGDLVARMAHSLSLDKAAKKIEKATGKPCNCEKRRKIMNGAVPNVPFT